MSEEQKKSKKVTKEVAEVKKESVSKVSKQSVYAFKPKGIMQRLSVFDDNGVVRVQANETIALTEEKINGNKDLQLLVASGELEKITN